MSIEARLRKLEQHQPTRWQGVVSPEEAERRTRTWLAGEGFDHALYAALMAEIVEQFGPEVCAWRT